MPVNVIDTRQQTRSAAGRPHLQQAGVVQHLHDLANAQQLLLRNVQPMVEGERQFGAHIFARYLLNVDERLQQDLCESIQMACGMRCDAIACAYILGRLPAVGLIFVYNSFARWFANDCRFCLCCLEPQSALHYLPRLAPSAWTRPGIRPIPCSSHPWLGNVCYFCCVDDTNGDNLAVTVIPMDQHDSGMERFEVKVLAEKLHSRVGWSFGGPM